MEITAPERQCFTCDVVSEYITLANRFTQDLSEVLLLPMWVIFLALAGLWIAIHGIKMIVGKGDILGLSHEFFFVAIATVLMVGQGPNLVNAIYSASLTLMGGAAAMVLSAGAIPESTGIFLADTAAQQADIAHMDGMRALVMTAEKGVFELLQVAAAVMAEATLTRPAPLIYAALLALPYVLLLIVFTAQVVVSIFRVVMIAALSPILMMAFGFGWGRSMAYTALRTLFASAMVLVGTTIALAICLYGVQAMDPSTYQGDVSDLLSLTSSKLWVAVLLGWMGFAFMAEATGIANSIAGSQLTNQAAAVITSGAMVTGIALISPSTYRRIGSAISGGAGVAGSVFGGGAKGGSEALSPEAQALKDKVINPSIDKGGKE